MKKFSLKKLFENDRFVQIFSLVAAALCWLIVAMTKNYPTTEIIRNVPVKIDPASSGLTSIGLHVVDDNQQYVDVKVEGLRSVVGSLVPEDFSLTVRLTGVTEPTTYELTPVSNNQSPNQDYTIQGFSPEKVKVRFDTFDKKTFMVTPVINGLAIAPGYTEKTTVVTPVIAAVEGPASSLEKIDKCVITAELINPLNKTYAIDLPIVLLDAAGAPLDLEKLHLTVDNAEAQLMIQVLKTANLPLTIDFTNIPRGFPVEELRERTQLSQRDVVIAGPSDFIDNLLEIKLGYIDIKSITLERVAFWFDVPLPSPSDQFMRLDNVTSVSAIIEDRDFTSATFNITSPKLINAPPNYNIETLADIIYDVEFVGRKDVIDQMTADDIVAEIDLSERALKTGSYPYPVKISVPGKGLVWAVGDHSVTIQVDEIEQ